jgi:hypothetical protein
MRTDAPAASVAPAERRVWLAAALLLSAALSLLLVLRSPCIGKDGPTFIRLAQDLARDFPGAVRAADQHPGYPMLLLGAHGMGGLLGAPEGNAAWAVAGRVVSALFGLLTVLAAWWLARRLFDDRVAGIAAVLIAALPLFCESASDVRSDSPHLFFYLLSACLLVEGLQRGRWAWFLAAGAAGGLAFWVRPEGLTPAVAGGLLLAWRLLRRPEQRARALVWGLCLLLGTAALVLPYVAVKGKFTAKKDLTQVVRDDAAPTPAATVAPADGKAAAPIIASAPASAAPSKSSRAAAGFVRMADRVLHGLRYFLLIPVLLALFAPRRLRAQSDALAFAATLAAVVVLLLMAVFLVGGYLAERHVMPLVALGAIWAGAGIAWLGARAPEWLAARGRVAAGWRAEVLCAAMAGLCVLLLLPRSVRPPYAHTAGLRSACLWVRAQATPGDALIANTHWAPFYAELPGSAFSWEEGVRDELDCAPATRYRFIVLYSRQDGWRLREHAALSAYRAVPASEMPGADNTVAVFVRRER